MKQIPEGCKTTSECLAQALGDPVATGAVERALRKKRLEEYKIKITVNPKDEDIFRNFETEKPLEEFRRFQERVSRAVVTHDAFQEIQLVAGVDVAYQGGRAYSACVVMDRSLNIVEKCEASVQVNFPYVPGYFSLREGPAIMAAIEDVGKFDAIIVGAHGIAHPRGFGLASQIGLELDKPSIGVAKGLLVGKTSESEDGSPIIWRGEVVGAKLCRTGHAPIYVSVGHKLCLETALDLIKDMLDNRLPEPLREAHRAASKLRKGSYSLSRT
ncbi:MAG: endonuclease V [Candidatus Bathyarchaeia archaeon]